MVNGALSCYNGLLVKENHVLKNYFFLLLESVAVFVLLLEPVESLFDENGQKITVLHPQFWADFTSLGHVPSELP